MLYLPACLPGCRLPLPAASAFARLHAAAALLHTPNPPAHIDQFNHPTPPQSPTPQALAYLATVWSVDIKARLHYRPVHTLSEATHVKVVPHALVGTRAIVPLHGKLTVGGL